MARFVQADRSQPVPLPPDIRAWVPEDDLAHVLVEADGLRQIYLQDPDGYWVEITDSLQ